MLRSWPGPDSTVPHAASSATGSHHAPGFIPAPSAFRRPERSPARKSSESWNVPCTIPSAPGLERSGPAQVRPDRRTGGRMSRRIAAGLLLVAAGAGCTSLTPSADCSSSPCPEGQTCDAPTHLCVLDLSPQISVLAPQPDAAVKDPALEVRGTVSTWSDATLVGMSYQLVDAGVAGGVPVDGGLFSLTIPLPPIDGQDVQLVLLARDSLSRERRVSVPFRVDDVA